MRCGLRESHLLRELRHPFTAFGALAQTTQNREQARNRSDTCFFGLIFIPFSGIHLSLFLNQIHLMNKLEKITHSVKFGVEPILFPGIGSVHRAI
jgi:hypothetical protein